MLSGEAIRLLEIVVKDAEALKDALYWIDYHKRDAQVHPATSVNIGRSMEKATELTNRMFRNIKEFRNQLRLTD